MANGLNQIQMNLIDVINPANEEVIGQVTAGTKDDIDMAVNAASEAFKSFSKTSQNERIEPIKKNYSRI